MSPHTNGLGGRLPLAERSDLSQPQQQLFDRMTQTVVPWAKRAEAPRSAAGPGRDVPPPTSPG